MGSVCRNALVSPAQLIGVPSQAGFDFAYKLHDDTDSNIRSLNSGGLQIDHWLEETILFECADDLQLAASIEQVLLMYMIFIWH